MGRFTPVYDPEKTRDEQDENELRKHRQFDTPFAQLREDLNNTGPAPKEDMKPLGKPTGDLYQDPEKLWRKKNALFDKEKMWGRETFSMGNQEQARADGKKVRDHMAEALFGRTIGVKGGKGEDNGHQVVQRAEVEQQLEKNEKGLWVRKKTAPKVEEDAPVSKDEWKCPKCKIVNSRQRAMCKECNFDRLTLPEESGLMRSIDSKEDPRLEAAKKRGRGTADAAQQALKALAARRLEQKEVMEEIGLTRPSRSSGSSAGATVNSSAQQVRPSKRTRKHRDWQGVQRTDEEAKKVVEKALGSSAVGASSAAAGAVSASPKPNLRSPSRKKSTRDCSLSLSISRSRSRSKDGDGSEDNDGEGTVEVDFF